MNHRLRQEKCSCYAIFFSYNRSFMINLTKNGRWANVVSTLTMLQAGLSKVWITAQAWYLPLSKSCQTSSGAHSASYSMGTRVLSLRGRRQWSSKGMRLTTQLHLMSRLTRSVAIPPPPLYAFMTNTGANIPLPLPALPDKQWFELHVKLHPH